ncbi:hypothetical protein, partial [Escherichia coli]|uniref:hypothetical protein n=1 Tax=Escherichia coli TaxID=562 RepID=UPI001953FB2D
GHEGFDGIDIERRHEQHPKLLSLKYPAIQFSDDQGRTMLPHQGNRRTGRKPGTPRGGTFEQLGIPSGAGNAARPR